MPCRMSHVTPLWSFSETVCRTNGNLFDLVGQLAAGSHQFAPNEVAFFDGIHPTNAAHGVLAAFADAVLTSDSTQFLDGT
jgi:phospholipase/lecithinase/hemolysin